MRSFRPKSGKVPLPTAGETAEECLQRIANLPWKAQRSTDFGGSCILTLSLPPAEARQLHADLAQQTIDISVGDPITWKKEDGPRCTIKLWSGAALARAEQALLPYNPALQVHYHQLCAESGFGGTANTPRAVGAKVVVLPAKAPRPPGRLARAGVEAGELALAVLAPQG